jgi:putative transposase
VRALAGERLLPILQGSVRKVQQRALRRMSWYAGDEAITGSFGEMQTMTKRQGKSETIDVKALLAEDEGFLRALVRAALQEVLEAEMTEALGAEEGERSPGRLGYRSVGLLRPNADHAGRQARTARSAGSCGAVLERAVRALSAPERALVAALAEMYVQGVSTRKVKAITEELCGHSFSASSISSINQRLDVSLAQFSGRPLAEPFPYVILDAFSSD